MTASSDVLIVGAGSAGLFCALGLAGSASVTVVETGPDAGTPPPPWMLYDYLLPGECYHSYADADTGLRAAAGPRHRRRVHRQLGGGAARPALVLRRLGRAGLVLAGLPARVPRDRVRSAVR